MSQKPVLLFIVGPTASGKTALSIELAKHFHTEIISADSRQVFKELNIGTAKPTADELLQVPHHLVGHLSIEQDYSAGKFETEALSIAEQLFKRYPLVIVSGGTGLYVNALLNGMDELPKIDEAVRKKVINGYEEKGLQWLQSQVAALDPIYYQQVDIQNPQRLMRALEVSIACNKPYSSFRSGKKSERPFDTIKIGLDPGREQLYANINRRVEKMMEQGLLEEVKSVWDYRDRNALQTVGYTELFNYLDGKTDYEEAVALIKQNTRRYAKRQMTWFRKDKEIKWFNPADNTAILSYVEQCMNEKYPSEI
ncbi:MAG: tRNA (adenosine(37)-N6)-dimethylallyltransferase MiaA [Chitinophagales bacterium]|nr:tRNA (adenosine(37)-N6)-dimethylallyltransferase MiaA [Chitinophagales bacterium]